MITHNFNTLDLLTSPVWIVSPFEEQLIYANSAARLLMQDLTFSQLRTGPYSVSSQKELPKYLSDLQNQHDIIEILTVQRKEEETALSCRLVLRELTETEPVIIFEGIEAPATLGLKASRSANYQRKKQGFYARFFLTNSAPMLLIAPSRDGQIVDANLAALNFYGYNHETMCQKHTWEINMLGRRVMPIMHEISHLPGGHKPLNFVHKLADGSTRHVQTYAGPIEIYGDKLMLCIVHDITEQKRLEEQLEHAAHHDAMTGLLNRRQFYHITEPGQMQHPAIGARSIKQLLDYSWTMPTPHGSYYKQLSELLDDQAQTPQVGVVCETFSACISLVAKSDFLSILPEEMGCDPLHGQGLVMLPVSEILPKAAYYLIQRRDSRQTPLTASLITQFRRECGYLQS